MSSEVDPMQITIAVFDRFAQKYKEVLEVKELDWELISAAVKTLNELSKHPETADEMIDKEILPVVSELLTSESAEVREQSARLLGTFALSAIGRQMFEYAFDSLKNLLEDPELAVREASAWTMKRLSVNDDGCQRMIEMKAPVSMINSFIKHSSEEELKKEDSKYLVYLLEAFVNLTFSDIGIQPLLGCNAIE